MKYLLISDLHYVLKHFDWVLNVASQFDAVIMAGDQIDGRSHVYMRVQIPVILKYLERLQTHTQLLVCSGNHDLNVRGGNGERIAKWLEPVREMGITTDGDSFEINDTLVYSMSLVGWTEYQRVHLSATGQGCRQNKTELDMGIPWPARQFPDQLDR